MLPVLLMLTVPVDAARGLWDARATGKNAASSTSVNSTTGVPLDTARATGKDAARSAGVNSTTGVPLDAARAKEGCCQFRWFQQYH
jgi:hypothetical protein